MADPTDDCASCCCIAEPDAALDVCAAAKRPCRHHCNCIWTQDCCHWCGGEFLQPDADSDPVWVAGDGPTA